MPANFDADSDVTPALAGGDLFDFKAQIVCIDRLSDQFLRYRLAADGAALAHAHPGQFVMLEAPGVLLRRPFSLLDVDSDDPSRFDLLIWVGGVGGTILSALASGTALRVLGPLGNGFPRPPRDALVVCVGGGFGVAPFHFAVRAWAPKADDGADALLQTMALFAGARTIRELPFLSLITQALKDWPKADLRVTTEDGSHGTEGVITSVLAPYLEHRVDEGERPVLYVCGSLGMTRAVAAVGERLNLPTWVSLEERMACGYGVCYGCPVPLAERTPDGSPRYARVCVDGPVFRREHVQL